jgi:glutamate--cysteine ligase
MKRRRLSFGQLPDVVLGPVMFGQGRARRDRDMTLAAITAAASQLDADRPADSQLTSSEEAAQYITNGCLIDGPLGRVGLEMEAHCFDPLDPQRRPSWNEITDILQQLPPLPGGSAVTVEPGGAVELSGPPGDGVAAAIGAMDDDQAVLRQAFANAGLGLVYLGADPLRAPNRVNPGARYRAMEEFFAASHSAEAGAAMMTSTASVQINLDAGPQAGWADRVRLAHALGPTMIAIAANSPMLGGEFSGWQSTRQWVWGQMDSARCGPILGASGDDPGTDWARYALKAPVMMVHNPEAVALTHYVSFADWTDGSALLCDRRPTLADLDYHLTTLFPPVRPRQWLEIRYLDSAPDEYWPAIAFTLAALLDDPAAADAAAAAVEPVATAWDNAARLGLGDRRLHEAAISCVAIAAEKAPAELTDAMQRLIHTVERGRCPGDDFSDQVIDQGIAATVSQLAQGGV